MTEIIVMTRKELSSLIDSAVHKRINPLQELINRKLNPQKKCNSKRSCENA
jgi:hypothetical protein